MGQGDITDPQAWSGGTPGNSDGRYSWFGNASGVTGGPITYVGDPAFLTGTASLTWSILRRAGDGSSPRITWSTDGGITPHVVTLGLEGTPQASINASGQINVPLAGAAGIIVTVTSANGSVTPGAATWVLAVGVTRNVNETLQWDSPNPYDPLSYNFARADNVSYDRDTLANLRVRVLIGLGFSNQAANPPPGVAAFVNDKLVGAQNYLYRRYTALHTRRFFRWKVLPGQRFYSLQDNDDDPLSLYKLDPLRPVEWAGIQDTRNVWYPLIRGIPPQLYTMIDKTWRPARYDIRQGLEVYPAPDQVYFLWLRGHFRKLAFAADGDYTTIDSELVYLHALSVAKKHYGQPDADAVQAMANSYRAELIAGTHLTSHYVPGTTEVPPAVRPTLIQYQN